MNIEVKTMTAADLNWSFDDKPPTYYLKTPNAEWGHRVEVDPHPCHAHSEKLVKELAAKVPDIIQIEYHATAFLLSHECVGRSNGQASENRVYKKLKPNPLDFVIVLHGKRIPLHPAMTRYLFFHEAAHCIDYYICNKLGLKDSGLDEDYAKFRDIPYSTKYGSMYWPTATGEIIANDIRVALFNAELEFWPHPVAHPNEFGIEKIRDFWLSKVKEANTVKAVPDKE
jgi:hypothetical protein